MDMTDGDNKTIKGQAWINREEVVVGYDEKNNPITTVKYSLVQDIITIYPGVVDGIDSVDEIIPDIWEDLLSGSGKFKTNNKGYFYWEYKMTDSQDDSNEVTIKYECPKPDYEVFERIAKLKKAGELESSYASYWSNKYEEATTNYEKNIAIQRKEVTFNGSSYIDPTTGELTTVDNITIKNSDLGDISNLLGGLF